MSKIRIDYPILDVPYYQQSHIATCGPAALMMVMKYWDNSFELSQKVENDLWKKTRSLFFLGGSLQYRMANAPMEMGFKTKIFQKNKLSDCYSYFQHTINFIENVKSYKSRKLKIPIQYGPELIDTIYETLKKRIPPLVFLNLEPILGENVFHWLVVTGINKNNVYVNDPYIPKGLKLNDKKDYKIDLKIFKNAITIDKKKILRLPSCVLIVYR